MLKTSIVLTALALAPVAAMAQQQQPIGEWMVENKLATIKIDDCGGEMWGVVNWERHPGGVDKNNPDPAKRTRPTLGMPIILAMKPGDGNRWEGEIYNSEDGRTYSARISLASPDVLRVEGCVLGILCGGQNWTRVEPKAEAGNTGRQAKQGAGRRQAAAAAAESDVCSKI